MTKPTIVLNKVYDDTEIFYREYYDEKLNTPIPLNRKNTKFKSTYSVEKELPSMIKLFSVQSYSGDEILMIKYIIDILKTLKGVTYEIDKNSNILITKGTLDKDEYYPCLVAHMDTVHRIVNDKLFKIITKKVNGLTELSCEYGIGGDDKCGIWLALKLLRELPKLKIVFTTEEETGGRGASAMDLSFFDNVGYLIEGDRRGNSDIITKIFDPICSNEFIDTISVPCNKYEYEEESGMFTDIECFKYNGLELSCINVSVGYYNPHTKNEVIIAEDLLRATQFVKECINYLRYFKYEHKIEKIIIPYHKYDKYYYEEDFEDFPRSCTCHKEYNLIDLNCQVCNPLVTKYSGIMCNCGEELEEYSNSYFCPFCSKTFIL